MRANLGVAYFDSRSLITGSYVFVAINPDVTNLEQLKQQSWTRYLSYEQRRPMADRVCEILYNAVFFLWLWMKLD